jgi:hypothetical protein
MSKLMLQTVGTFLIGVLVLDVLLFLDLLVFRENSYVERSNPARPGGRGSHPMIGSSVTEADWLNKIPSDHPTLIVAEGLLMYLSTDDAWSLLERAVNHFPGGQLIFDAVSHMGIRKPGHMNLI